VAGRRDKKFVVKTKRVYDPVSTDDGKRVLIDRLWPRGIKKEEAKIDEWASDIAPSTELRKWFSHDPEKWQEFKRRYKRELEDKGELVAKLRAEADNGTVTLLFAAKDTEHMNAAVLREVLDNYRPRNTKKNITLRKKGRG
jgi:uncharacterized protein YeaO (DUF488 family)